MINDPELQAVLRHDVLVILRTKVVRQQVLNAVQPATHRWLDCRWLPDKGNVRLVSKVYSDSLLERGVDTSERTDRCSERTSCEAELDVLIAISRAIGDLHYSGAYVCTEDDSEKDRWSGRDDLIVSCGGEIERLTYVLKHNG